MRKKSNQATECFAYETMLNSSLPTVVYHAFDATIGLLGMLEVLMNRRKSGEPNDATVKKLEGWILGQEWGS